MIDLQLGEFCQTIEYIRMARKFAESDDPSEMISERGRSTLRSLIENVRGLAIKLEMDTVIHRWAKISVLLEGPITADTMVREIDELLDAIKNDASYVSFCHYQEHRVTHLHHMPDQWADAFRAFPAIKTEVESSIDCYALRHNTACVFHMSRVGEIGLRAIGRERGVKAVKGNKVPIDWATWGEVFKAIEPTMEQLRKKPNGVKKSNALAFYSRVLSDLRAIQSLYRDQTMHLRDEYDDGEAYSAMFRVRELMNTLASKLDENSARSIRWAAWK